MDAYDEMIDSYLKNFVKDCQRAFLLTCKFTNRTEIPVTEFVAKVKEYGTVRSDIEFYDCFFKTQQCFGTHHLLSNGAEMCFYEVCPEKYKFDMAEIERINKMFGGKLC